MPPARMFVIVFRKPGTGEMPEFQGNPKSGPGIRTYHPKVWDLQDARVYNSDAAARRSAVGRGWEVHPVTVAIEALNPSGGQKCG